MPAVIRLYSILNCLISLLKILQDMAIFSGMRLLVGLILALYSSNSLTISALTLYKSSKSTLSPSLTALMGVPFSSNRLTTAIWLFSAANSKGLIRLLILTNGTAF